MSENILFKIMIELTHPVIIFNKFAIFILNCQVLYLHENFRIPNRTVYTYTYVANLYPYVNTIF